MKNSILTRLTLDIATDLHTRLKVIAAKRNKSMKALIVEWITAALEQAEQE